MCTEMGRCSSPLRSSLSFLHPPFILPLAALSSNSLSNYPLYSHPTEILLSECWTDLRNKLFYVRCTKELIIAQWLYIVACMHSGKLATEGRDLMTRTARARTVQDPSLANGSLRPSLSLSCAWGKCPFVVWFIRHTPEVISSPCLFLIKIDYSVLFFFPSLNGQGLFSLLNLGTLGRCTVKLHTISLFWLGCLSSDHLFINTWAPTCPMSGTHSTSIPRPFYKSRNSDWTSRDAEYT